MYRFSSREHENREFKRSIILSKEDILKAKELSSKENIDFVNYMNECVLKEPDKDEYEFFSEDIISFIGNEDWIYFYKEIELFSEYELNLAISKLEELLLREKEKLEEIMKIDIFNEEIEIIFDEVSRKIKKIEYQLQTFISFKEEKYGSKGKTK